MIRLCLLAALAACDAPYGTCRSGNYRDPGPGCTAPTLMAILDGDPREWQRPDLVSIPMCDPDLPCQSFDPCPQTEALLGCCPGDVTALQFAVDGTTLLFHAAADPATTEYALFLQSLYPSGEHDTVEVSVGGTDMTVSLNQIDLTGYPVTAALGARDLEVQLPFDVLPFRTTAATAIAGGQCPTRRTFAYACWDPTTPGACGNY